MMRYLIYSHLSIDVPQGCVLEPILYTIYFNDFLNFTAYLKTVHLAYDNPVAAHGGNFDVLCSNLNQECMVTCSLTGHQIIYQIFT